MQKKTYAIDVGGDYILEVRSLTTNLASHRPKSCLYVMSRHPLPTLLLTPSIIHFLVPLHTCVALIQHATKEAHRS